MLGDVGGVERDVESRCIVGGVERDYDLNDPYQICKRCGAYNEAYGESIACDCELLKCGCYRVCISGHSEN